MDTFRRLNKSGDTETREEARFTNGAILYSCKNECGCPIWYIQDGKLEFHTFSGEKNGLDNLVKEYCEAEHCGVIVTKNAMFKIVSTSKDDKEK